MYPSVAQKGFAFIPVNGIGKPRTAEDRKLVRSHAMQGKNLRIGVHPVPKANVYREVGEGAEERRLLSRIPSPNRTALPPFRLGDTLDVCSPGHVFDVYTTSAAAMCNVGLGVDLDLSKRLWFQWLMQDEAYTHPILFCISASHCALRQIPLGKTEFYHLGKTITVIKERLSDNALCAHNSTVCLILSLILVFSSLGDYTTARLHMKPLIEMARLRGGTGSFQMCAELYLRVLRFDLAYLLHSGEMPLFLQSFAPDTCTDPSGTESPCSARPDIQGQKLISIFKDLQLLVNELNHQDENAEQVSAAKFQNSICMLQYRLCGLQGKLPGHDSNLAESLRLAMLGFIGSTFRIKGITFRYTYLENALEECCAVNEPSTPSGDPQDLMLWILMMGAITVQTFDAESHPWLRARWIAENGHERMDWGEMRERLRNIAWIDSIHDLPGRQAFYVLTSQEDRGAVAGLD